MARGLGLVAVAVVALAVVAMARALAGGARRAGIAAFAAGASIVAGSAAAQLAVLAAAAVAGTLLLRRPDAGAPPVSGPAGVSRRSGVVALAAFALLLAVLPFAARSSRPAVEAAAAYAGAGALVFGGGHVVVPALDARVVDAGPVDRDDFVAGYGAVQAMPGPLFTVASYLGASHRRGPDRVAGAILATIAIFLPGVLLLVGVLPFWAALRRRRGVLAAVGGMNAAVVGILAAALVDPLAVEAVRGPADAAGVVLALVALRLRVPVWAVVAVAAAAGLLVA